MNLKFTGIVPRVKSGETRLKFSPCYFKLFRSWKSNKVARQPDALRPTNISESVRLSIKLWAVSDFRRGVNHIFVLLGCYAAKTGSYRRFGTTYQLHPLKSIGTRRRNILLAMMAIRLCNTHVTFVVKRFCYHHNLQESPVIITLTNKIKKKWKILSNLTHYTVSVFEFGLKAEFAVR